MTTRILVVDDSMLDVALTLRALDACLSKHSIDTTGDGAEAYRLLNDRRFDLMILDIKMPFVDGFELMRSMNHPMTQRPSVIVVSNSSLSSDIYLAKKLGAIEYVQKALDFSEFRANLQAALGRHGFC